MTFHLVIHIATGSSRKAYAPAAREGLAIHMPELARLYRNCEYQINTTFPTVRCYKKGCVGVSGITTYVNEKAQQQKGQAPRLIQQIRARQG